jgi:energy-coupling factor transporter ATP-binding protein EcfA2
MRRPGPGPPWSWRAAPLPHRTDCCRFHSLERRCQGQLRVYIHQHHSLACSSSPTRHYPAQPGRKSAHPPTTCRSDASNRPTIGCRGIRPFRAIILIVINKLVCVNYRGLEDFEINLTPMTVLVGANGSGKSTVLQALDFLLGDRWASLAHIDIPGDFTALDNARPLAIQAWFDPCLEYEDAKGDIHSIGAIEYRCEPYKIRSGPHLPGDLRDIYRPLSPAGKEVTVCTKRPQKGSPPVFSPLISMNSGLRDQARVLNIPTARAVSNQLPGRRGSIMAKLLAEVRASFLRNAAGERGQFKEQYANAVAALRTEQLQEIEASIADTARRMLGAAGRPGRHPACGQ